MSSTEHDDRRRYPRIPRERLVSFSPVEKPPHLGASRNLSRGGICFDAIGCEFELGALLRIHFNVDQRTIDALGRVVWSTELDPLTTEVGVEFVEIAPDMLALIETELAAPEGEGS